MNKNDSESSWPIIGIILAAGKGKRLNSRQINKVCLPFNGRPIIDYAASLMCKVTKKTICVIGAFGDSVKQVLANYPVIFVEQKRQLGTAHAVKVAVASLREKSAIILVGYGDHMMFYSPKTIKKLIELHRQTGAVMSLISIELKDFQNMAWGKIIRGKNGEVVDSKELKDCSPKEQQITELNAGFYCFNLSFLRTHLPKVPRSSVSGEYYLNSLVKIANNSGLTVSALKVPFREVGIGVNRKEELEESQTLYRKISLSPRG